MGADDYDPELHRQLQDVRPGLVEAATDAHAKYRRARARVLARHEAAPSPDTVQTLRQAAANTSADLAAADRLLQEMATARARWQQARDYELQQQTTERDNRIRELARAELQRLLPEHYRIQRRVAALAALAEARATRADQAVRALLPDLERELERLDTRLDK